MRVLKNKYLVKERDQVEKKGQLYLFAQEELTEFKKVEVIAIAPEERDVRVGDMLTVKQDAGEFADLQGNKIIRKEEIIRYE